MHNLSVCLYQSLCAFYHPSCCCMFTFDDEHYIMFIACFRIIISQIFDNKMLLLHENEGRMYILLQLN